MIFSVNIVPKSEVLKVVNRENCRNVISSFNGKKSRLMLCCDKSLDDSACVDRPVFLSNFSFLALPQWCRGTSEQRACLQRRGGCRERHRGREKPPGGWTERNITLSSSTCSVGMNRYTAGGQENTSTYYLQIILTCFSVYRNKEFGSGTWDIFIFLFFGCLYLISTVSGGK